jgi:hypothetical protein
VIDIFLKHAQVEELRARVLRTDELEDNCVL